MNWIIQFLRFMWTLAFFGRPGISKMVWFVAYLPEDKLFLEIREILGWGSVLEVNSDIFSRLPHYFLLIFMIVMWYAGYYICLYLPFIVCHVFVPYIGIEIEYCYSCIQGSIPLLKILKIVSSMLWDGDFACDTPFENIGIWTSYSKTVNILNKELLWAGLIDIFVINECFWKKSGR